MGRVDADHVYAQEVASLVMDGDFERVRRSLAKQAQAQPTFIPNRLDPGLGYAGESFTRTGPLARKAGGQQGQDRGSSEGGR